MLDSAQIYTNNLKELHTNISEKKTTHFSKCNSRIHLSLIEKMCLWHSCHQVHCIMLHFYCFAWIRESHEQYTGVFLHHKKVCYSSDHWDPPLNIWNASRHHKTVTRPHKHSPRAVFRWTLVCTPVNIWNAPCSRKPVTDLTHTSTLVE